MSQGFEFVSFQLVRSVITKSVVNFKFPIYLLIGYLASVKKKKEFIFINSILVLSPWVIFTHDSWQ